MQWNRQPNIENFGNVDWDGEPTPPEETRPDVELSRRQATKRFLMWEWTVEEFSLLKPITYVDDRGGSGTARTITVPRLAPPGTDNPFTTDLTSVPKLVTWLVPKSGRHLPGALIHDGLIGNGDPTYQNSDGEKAIDRIEADRIFRNGMHDTGVDFIRRWVVWAAVANASLWSGARAESGRFTKWYYRVVMVAVFGHIGYLGLCATLDVLDIDKRSQLPWGLRWMVDLELPWLEGLPKMAGLPTNLPWIDEDATLWFEVLQGLSAAVVIPLVLSILWLRYLPAGAIAGIALATLVHVTLAVALVALAYLVAELLCKVVGFRAVVALGVLSVALAVLVESW